LLQLLGKRPYIFREISSDVFSEQLRLPVKPLIV
jgi:hypothetical protein